MGGESSSLGEEVGSGERDLEPLDLPLEERQEAALAILSLDACSWEGLLSREALVILASEDLEPLGGADREF